MATVATAAVLTFFMSPTLKTVISEALRLKSGATHRGELWKLGIDTFASHPVFGVGYMAPREALSGRIYYNDPVEHLLLGDPQGKFAPHNIYIYALCSAGVLGFVFLVILFRQIIRSMYSGLRNARSPGAKIASQLGLSLMGGIIAHGFFETGGFFGHGSWATYFWVLLGIISAIQAGALDSDSSVVADSLNPGTS